MAEKDPYRVLGVGKDASDGEIKRAFRKKARQFHPDRNPDDANAEAKFKEVQSAYEKIGTAESRREFDQQQQMATARSTKLASATLEAIRQNKNSTTNSNISNHKMANVAHWHPNHQDQKQEQRQPQRQIIPASIPN